MKWKTRFSYSKNYGKFRRISLGGHFIKHKPLISEDVILETYFYLYYFIPSAVIDAHNATLGAILDAKETANEALQDANIAISDAFNSTVTSVQATGETLIIALLSTKEQVQGM